MCAGSGGLGAAAGFDDLLVVQCRGLEDDLDQGTAAGVKERLKSISTELKAYFGL